MTIEDKLIALLEDSVKNLEKLKDDLEALKKRELDLVTENIILNNRIGILEMRLEYLKERKK